MTTPARGRPFKKGESGNANGAPRFRGEWREAVYRALDAEDPETRKKNLDLVAEKLVAQAKAGDVSAIKEIADRIDGKPSQAVEHSGEVQATVYHIVTGVPRDAG